MHPIPVPTELPPHLQPLFARMNHTDAQPDQWDCAETAVLTDWLYIERWHAELADQAELEWLLAWLRPCHTARAVELADAVCILRLEAGEIEASIELATSLLAQTDDFSLRHTLALALAAQGNLDQAISQLEHALNQATHSSDAVIPSEQRIQAWLDLTRLLQNNKALFKAIRPAKQAIALAQTHQQDDLLIEAIHVLVEQLIDQGGADEAWNFLKPLLSREPTASQQALWTLAFARLSSELTPPDINQGAACLLAARNPDPLIKLMIQRAESSQDHHTLLIAFILGLIFRAPIDVTAPLAAKLLLRDHDRQRRTAPLIAAASMALAEIPDERSSKRAHWYRDAMMQLISVAQHQGIPEAAVKQWAEDEQLLLEQGIIERTYQTLMHELTHIPPWLPQAIALRATTELLVIGAPRDAKAPYLAEPTDKNGSKSSRA